MPISRQKKADIVKRAGESMQKAASIIFVHFKGLSVAAANELRRVLRGEGVSYLVMKKTLLSRTLKELGIKEDFPDFKGELAVAYGADMIAPAKHIVLFEKKFEGAVTPFGGVLEGKFISREEVLTLASIPGREILYGKFVTVLNGPIQNTVSVLNNTVASLVRAFDQIAKSKQG